MRETGLAIFDLDGVLADGEPLIKQAQSIVLASQGVDVTPEWMFRNAHGLSSPDTVKRVSALTGIDLDFSRYRNEYDQALELLYREKLRATQEIHAQLDVLIKEGISICIATSSRLANAVKKLEICGLVDYFPENTIFTSEQVKHGKPAPDLMLLAAATMRFSVNRCTVIEDSPSGIQAAKAAGMYAIGYVGGGHYKIADAMNVQDLQRAGADIIIDHHSLLPVLLP